jgi:hypothetical protein
VGANPIPQIELLSNPLLVHIRPVRGAGAAGTRLGSHFTVHDLVSSRQLRAARVLAGLSRANLSVEADTVRKPADTGRPTATAIRPKRSLRWTPLLQHWPVTASPCFVIRRLGLGSQIGGSAAQRSEIMRWFRR